MVKWMGALLALLAVIGLVASSGSLPCAEVAYSGGTMVDCESMSIFEPSDHEDGAESKAGVLTSIALPPSLMGFVGAIRHGNCKTTEVPEGQWTVCNDGFSMLERDGTMAAWALGLRPGEDRPRNANRVDEREEEYVDGLQDCGPFECAEYVEDPYNPAIRAHVDSLSPRARARLTQKLKAWERQEVERDLVQARGENTTLHERLKELAASEAELELVESLAQVDPGSVAPPWRAPSAAFGPKMK